jgi:hypothetical protein
MNENVRSTHDDPDEMLVRMLPALVALHQAINPVPIDEQHAALPEEALATSPSAQYDPEVSKSESLSLEGLPHP